MATDWKARLEAARAAKDKAIGLLNEADREELAARAEEDRIHDETRAAKREARDLDLKRRLDVAREKLGSAVQLYAFDAEDTADGAGTYILRDPPVVDRINPCSQWQMAIANAKDAKGRDLAMRQFAAQCVFDWNGLDPDAGTNAADMFKTWDRHGFLSTTIATKGAELAGLTDLSRKS